MRPARPIRQILQHQDIPWRCLNPQSAKENTHTHVLAAKTWSYLLSLSAYPFLSEWTMERLDEVATAIKPKKKVLFKVKKKLDEKIQQQHATAAPNGARHGNVRRRFPTKSAFLYFFLSFLAGAQTFFRVSSVAMQKQQDTSVLYL